MLGIPAHVLASVIKNMEKKKKKYLNIRLSILIRGYNLIMKK